MNAEKRDEKKKKGRDKTLESRNSDPKDSEKNLASNPPDDEESNHEIDKLIEDLTNLGEPSEEGQPEVDGQPEEEVRPEEGGQPEEEVRPEEDGQPEEEDIPETTVIDEEDLWESTPAVELKNNFNYCPNCGRKMYAGQCLYCAERLVEAEEPEEYIEEEYEEDDYTRWREEMKKRGELNIVGIFCVIVASIYLMYISYPAVLDGLAGEFTLESFTFNFFLFIIGLGALLGGFAMARHVIIYGRLFDTTFEKEIYARLEPAFAEVGGIRGDLTEIYERMERMNLHMKRMERRVLASTNGGTSELKQDGAVRYIFLMILTMAVFFYILGAPGEYAIYLLTAMFLVWWAGVTSDYNLWKVNFAWTWSFFALVVVPVASMLISVVFGISLMIGIIGIALTLYAISYLSWAKYYVEGTIPDFLPSFKDEE